MTISSSKYTLAMIVSFLVAVTGVTTADAELVSLGDKVSMNYSCYLPNGKLLYTTLEKIHNDLSIKKSSAYLAPDKGFPAAEVFAGSGYGGPDFSGIPYLNSEMAGQISKTLPGMTVGDERTVKIRADEVSAKSESDRYLTQARATLLKRINKFPIPKEAQGKPIGIKLGDEIPAGRSGLIQKVVKIEKEAITMQLMVGEGDVIQTPLGPAKVDVVDEEHLKRTLLLKKGDLIMFGMFLGLVVKADEDSITFDYCQPFGGNELTCKVRVDSILERHGAK